MTLIVSILYFFTILFFGWQTARVVLRERRIECLLAFAGVLGLGLYTFFINIVGHVVPIQTAFYAVLLAFLFFALASFVYRRARPLEWGIDTRWKNILLAFVLFVTLSVGFISFRHPMDLATIREPTAVTMAEGNFPPVEIFNPTVPFRYHYGSDLLAAATYNVTGMPLYLAYDVQNAIFAGSLFLLSFLLVALFVGDSFTAFFASVSMLYAGSLVVVYGFKGPVVLYEKYVLGQHVDAPFRFVSEAIAGAYSVPVVNAIIAPWSVMAFSLMMATVYLYFRLLKSEKEGYHLLSFLVGGALLALLALVAESYFVVLCVAMGVYPVVYFCLKRDMPPARRMLITAFVLGAVAAPFALLQGGLLGAAVAQQLHVPGTANTQTILYTDAASGSSPFTIGTPTRLFDGRPVYDPRFVLEWGVLVAVLVGAFVFLYKRQVEFTVFIATVVLLFFAIPLLVDSSFVYIAGQLGRFFPPVNLFGGLLAGLFLASLYRYSPKPVHRGLVILVFVILTAQGIFTHMVWVTVGYPPGGPLNPNERYFAKAGTMEADAYRWVKQNTTKKDLFLIIKDTYTECGPSGAPNCLFILNTGRMAPIFVHQGAGEDARAETSGRENAALFKHVSTTCDPTILRELGYTYVYVDDAWSKGLEGKCVKNNKVDLVYQTSEGQKFIRIYKLATSD